MSPAEAVYRALRRLITKECPEAKGLNLRAQIQSEARKQVQRFDRARWIPQDTGQPMTGNAPVTIEAQYLKTRRQAHMLNWGILAIWAALERRRYLASGDVNILGRSTLREIAR